MNQPTVMNQPDTPPLPPYPPVPPQPAMSPEQLHADLNAIRSVLTEGVAARNSHRNLIAVGNFLCGGLVLIAVPILLVVFSIPAIAAPHEDGSLIPLVIGVAIACLLLVIASPFFIAGWGLLKNKSWGIAAALVTACLNLLHFPLGTALSIYTIWAVSSGHLAPPPRR